MAVYMLCSGGSVIVTNGFLFSLVSYLSSSSCSLLSARSGIFIMVSMNAYLLFSSHTSPLKQICCTGLLQGQNPPRRNCCLNHFQPIRAKRGRINVRYSPVSQLGCDGHGVGSSGRRRQCRRRYFFHCISTNE